MITQSRESMHAMITSSRGRRAQNGSLRLTGAILQDARLQSTTAERRQFPADRQRHRQHQRDAMTLWRHICLASALLVSLAPAVVWCNAQKTMHCDNDSDCQKMFSGSSSYVCCFQLSCNDKIRYFRTFSGCSPRQKCEEMAKRNELAGLGMHFATRLHQTSFTKYRSSMERSTSGELCASLMRLIMTDVAAPRVPIYTGEGSTEIITEFDIGAGVKKPPPPPDATDFSLPTGIALGNRSAATAGRRPHVGPQTARDFSVTAAPDPHRSGSGDSAPVTSETEQRDRPALGTCGERGCARGQRCCVRVDCDEGLPVAARGQWNVDDYCVAGTACPLAKNVGKDRRRPQLRQYYMSVPQWELRNDRRLKVTHLFGEVERDCVNMDVFFKTLQRLR